MKNTLLTIGLAGLTTALLSSFAFTQKSDNAQNPKKNRHVRLVRIENGKKMEIDTVFTNDDVFVWNGDTINPEKPTKEFENFGLKNKKGNVKFLRHRGKPGESTFNVMSPDDNVEVFADERDDTTGERVMIRKRMKDGDADHFIFRNTPNMKDLPPAPPVPPVPPVPHVKMFGMQHSGKIIDLNDPNIISYKKKEMSGGREKIEIIRKKSNNNENETFNFRIDDDLMMPEPPDVPEFYWKSDKDSLNMKVIEKKKIINGKDGKEIEVKVEKEENK